MKFFIASSRSNIKEIKNLIDNLESLGHQATTFISGDDSSLFAAGTDWRNRAELKKIFEQELTRVEEADHFILLLPAGKNSHLAAGVAYGFNKHLTLIGQPQLIESDYFIFDTDYKNIAEYVVALRAKA
jgi:hypothetical protein